MLAPNNNFINIAILLLQMKEAVKKGLRKQKAQKEFRKTQAPNIIEIIIHGRGGQGAVTTGRLLAVAAFHDKKFSQAFPNFGVERTGAPSHSYCRISSEPIKIRSQVYAADIILVLDASLIEALDISKELKTGSIVVVNSHKKSDEMRIKLPALEKMNAKLFTVDASSIAMKIFNKPIVNTPILGAFAAITKIVSLGSLNRAVDEVFAEKGKQLSELNKKAISEVYDLSLRSVR